MLKKMLKFLVVVIFIAVPISCTTEDYYEISSIKSTENYYDISSIKSRVEQKSDFKILCRDVSDEDLERNERLYQEYEKCVNDKVDSKQLSADFDNVKETMTNAFFSNSKVTEEQNSMIVTTIKKYCPNANSIIKCEDILSPITTNCFTDDHKKSDALAQRIKISILDFFCQEDGKQAETFIKEKFLDCMHANDDAFGDCASQVVPLVKVSDDKKVTYATENELCKSLDNFANCFIPKMEQCELSQTIGTLLKSFNTYVQTNACTSSTNPTSK